MKEDKEITKEISELIKLTNQVKELDNRRSQLAKEVLEHMKHLEMKNFLIDWNEVRYIVERCSSVRYKDADPKVVRSLLGKTGEKYIREYVMPELRSELPPHLADKIFPIDRETEYVRVRVFKDELYS
jgi:hypothetical protein